MYVCMCVCMYVCMFVCICMYHVRMHAHICVSMYVCMYVYTNIVLYLYPAKICSGILIFIFHLCEKFPRITHQRVAVYMLSNSEIDKSTGDRNRSLFGRLSINKWHSAWNVTV
jgi:hypothetical protein